MAEPYLTVYSQQLDESEELKAVKERVAKMESERKNQNDVFNTLMCIANGRDWGYSKENIDELWKNLTPKLNIAIKQMNEQK